MVEFLQEYPEVKYIIDEKTDRLPIINSPADEGRSGSASEIASSDCESEVDAFVAESIETAAESKALQIAAISAHIGKFSHPLGDGFTSGRQVLAMPAA